MPTEPTEAEARAAVFSLPYDQLVELAKGPLEDPDDPDACRICDLYDEEIFNIGRNIGPHTRAIFTIIDWHRWWSTPNRDGRGPEAFRRCKLIYAWAAEELAARAARFDRALDVILLDDLDGVDDDDEQE